MGSQLAMLPKPYWGRQVAQAAKTFTGGPNKPHDNAVCARDGLGPGPISTLVHLPDRGPRHDQRLC